MNKNKPGSYDKNVKSTKKINLLQKRPADDGAGAVTAAGILPGQWRVSQSQHGHADVLADNTHKS